MFSKFIFIPIYIHYLGIENFSIISFTLVIAGLLIFVDSGITATLSRELASKSKDSCEKENIFFTLETLYFIIVLIVIVIVFSFSDFLAYTWLKIDSFNKDEISYFVRIAGIGMGFEFLAKFYIGGLSGLEKQVKANCYQVYWGIVRNGVVIFVIIYYPSLEYFFIWQTISTIIYVILLRISLLNSINKGMPFFAVSRIDTSVIKRVWKFAFGMLLIALVSGLSTQMDKFAISKLLNIDSLGYYTIAFSLSMGIVLLISPISTAILPRLTAMYTSGDEKNATLLFYKMFKISIVIIFSFGSILIFWAKDVLWIWTGDLDIVNSTHLCVSILAIAMIMLALQVLPYTVAIANAYTKLFNYTGLSSILITMPLYWIFVKKYGLIGAACTFCIVQTCIAFLYIFVINKKFLKGITAKKIFFNDILFSAVIITMIALILNFIPFYFNSRILHLGWIFFCSLMILSLSCLIILPKSDILKYIIIVTNILKRKKT